MLNDEIKRRDFLKTLLAGVSTLALDWSVLPRGIHAQKSENEFDAIIIGSGLGGLTCAAAFARQGFRPLVLEKHDRPGGYATTFKRPGGFEFDVSLHSITVGERDGIHNLIPGFPEIRDVEFVPHPNLYRAIFPDYDIRVPQRNLKAYTELLTGCFPEEKAGIEGLIADMQGLFSDINKFSRAQGQVDMMRFPVDFPFLFNCYNKTWAQMVDARLQNPKLKAIVSALWGYYGLPPSQLASFYYALPTIGYLEHGGFYPRGRSQKISNAFVQFIEEKGGQVLLNQRVTEILMKDQSAYGVRTEDGKEYKAKVVVSNANAYDTFHTMMPPNAALAEYLARMEKFSVSLSNFQIFLGLKKDLIREVGIKDTEIFYETGYDAEAGYRAALNAEVENGGYGMMLYDNLYDGYSPKGKNTLTIMTLQGYDHWQKYEADYFSNKKEAYRAEKERIANILIDKVEQTLLPGLRKAIAVKEIGTPLTNVRYTGNYRGAIYGWDQTLDNSGPQRLPHATPIKNLYLAGAWTQPGHGYGGVIGSGLQCFGEIMKSW
ncbi:MAG: NAD(P)/FAD-dependent oxidoreductase [candidate division KSB1 bacterium]|nr:NAD(P)/FAD-dependent oxidoreductase [candidate division KSB1 bacterium]MDZ7302712.1 NAD(P)/FAD-dependent oxidoreductase [candidate division KSB1 bacterium]MDZ7311757.1 NAD(P)/FAD-dependent oxidoreductase [candidate division KSB1 bacterium]